MKNNNFFRVVILGLSFGMTIIGCDTGSSTEKEEEQLPELPPPTGTNELGDKSYEDSDDRWVFNADGTYRYFDGDDGEWIEEENGNYSWDSSGEFKTVTLAPQRTSLNGTALYDKAGWKVAARNFLVSQGLTEANVAEMSKGHYTTIKAFIDAYADYSFALQLCNYTISGDAIGTFVEMGAYGYANAKGGKVVVQNDTSSTLTVTTYNATATPAAATVSAGEEKEVFTSDDDAILTKIEITAENGNFGGVEIDEGGIFGGGGSSAFSPRTSYETEPMIVGDGRTVTITVE